MAERGAFPGDSKGVGREELTSMRVQRFLSQRIAPAEVIEPASVTISAWTVGGEPVSFATAIRQTFVPFAVGDSWGAAWDTTWFRIDGEVPAAWRHGTVELYVDLGFNGALPGFQAEGLVYSADGAVLKGIHPRNRRVGLPSDTGPFTLYLEAAANPDVADGFSFRATTLGAAPRYDGPHQYRLGEVRLSMVEPEVWELEQDATAVLGLARQLDPSLPRRAELFAALDAMVDAVDPDDVRATIANGRAALRDVLSRPAHASAHHITAVGHAHIDSAWLWPTRETARKVARTFANVLDLIGRDESFVFVASSAQHFEWLKQSQPALFERVVDEVRAGRIVPVGGTWVENDTVMPGGESLVRQFVEGKRLFREEFGIDPQEVWLPDSFGFSAGLPQIIRGVGSRWFLTQKISWNDTNRMPHHTFWWEGIDGSRVLTHFPPTDTYNGDLTAEELARAQRQYSERGRTNSSLDLFGWGDGGGGPTREMVASGRRAADLEGSPIVDFGTPAEFFSRAERETDGMATWVGELYLELHRGTYTSQARTKRGNRRSEALLREAELWATTANLRLGIDYPTERLSRAWRAVLLNQFHDILPGSSIAWVYQEVERRYAEVEAELDDIIGTSLAALAGVGDTELTVNAAPFRRGHIDAMSVAVAEKPERPTFTVADSGYEISNAKVHARFDSRGLLSRLVDRRTARQLIHPDHPALALQLFRDTPRQWDAWDVDEDDRVHQADLVTPESVEVQDGDLVVRHAFGASTATLRISLDEASSALEVTVDVDWHEREKLLKLAIPLDLRADRATSEIAFGHVHRPVHANTSWDTARFETVMHRWLHVGEPGIGVAIGNSVAYGSDVRSRAVDDHSTIIEPRVSLLRAPLFPDPDADQGEHRFVISVRPVHDLWSAVDEGYRLHHPTRRIRGGGEVTPLIAIANGTVVVDTVKLADDGSGDVIVRLYEGRGAGTVAWVVPGFAWADAVETDLLERELPTQHLVTAADGIELRLGAFGLATLRLRPAPTRKETR